MVDRQESLGIVRFEDSFSGPTEHNAGLCPHKRLRLLGQANFSLMPSLRGPGLRAVGDQTSPTNAAPAALPQHNRTLLDTRCHNTMGCRPLTSGGDHLSHKAPHMTSSQTPLTQMSLVPTSKMATKSTLMTSSSTLAKSTMLKIKSSKT